MPTHPSPSLILTFSLMLLCPLACTSTSQPQAFTPIRDKLATLDEFGTLLVKAGLPTEALPTGSELSPNQARQLQLYFDLNPPRLTEYSPWLVANVLLEEVRKQKGAVPRAELGRRIQEFRTLYVLRRDGYLTEALSGRPEQCVGPVEVRDNGLRAGAFEVDHFYRRGNNKQWEPVDMNAPSISADR